MKRRTIISALLFLLTFIGLYALAASLIERTYKRRLIDYDRNPVETVFACPNGKLHQILLGVPKSLTNKTASFAGRLQLIDQKSGKAACDIAFKEDTTQTCNWLDGHDLYGHILTWKNKQRENITPKHEYRLVVHFDEPPPPQSSLWLSWVN